MIAAPATARGAGRGGFAAVGFVSEARSQASERIPAIDAIKAAAIVAVVMMHAGPAVFGPGPDRVVRWLTFAWTPFHVPSFLIIAGFLYYRPTPIGGPAIRARLARLLVPYLIASACVQALGLSTATSLRDVVFQLLTGSSLFIYYFIFMLTWCILLTWPLSRTPSKRVIAGLVLLLVTTVACEGYGRLAPTEAIAGGFIRGHLVLITEFYLYPLAYFLIGWLAAPQREVWSRLAREHQRLLLAASLAGVMAFVAADPWTETFMPVPSAARVVYTLCVIGALACVPASVATARPIRFLSEATLGIYLYHAFFQSFAQPGLETWSPLSRTLALAMLGLVGASALCAAGRRLLGSRARLLLGA
jgi:fucose 4-O-acetylase-like acetyltransferase